MLVFLSYFFQFARIIDEMTEACRGEMTCSRLHTEKSQGIELEFHD